MIPNPRRRELFGIQSLRGIAAVMVVLNHIQLWQSKYFLHDAVAPLWFSVGESGVDLFFLISGFIMMYVTPLAFKGWRDQVEFLIRRLFRIYPAYWGIALLLLCVWLVNPKLISNHQGNHVDVISSLLLIPSSSAPILVVAWTLVYEVYFYFVASFVFYCEGITRLLLTGLWFTTIAVSNYIHPQLFESSCLNVWLSPLSLEFISGMVLAYLMQIGTIRIYGTAACCLLVAVLLAGFFAGLGHGRFSVDRREPIRLLIYGLPAFIVLWIVLQMEIQHKWNYLKKIAWLGDRSYSIYLLHVPVIASFFQLASIYMPHPGSGVVFLLTLLILFFLLISVEMFYQMIEKPSHIFAKRVAVRLKPL